MGFQIRIDGAIVIHIERNRRNNTLSPTPHDIEQALATSTSPVVIDLWEDQPDKKADHVQRNELFQYFHVFLNFLHRWKGIRLWAPWVTPESFHGRQFLPSPLLESIELGGPPGYDTFKVVQLLSMCWMPTTVQYQKSIVPSSPLQKFTIRDWQKCSKISNVQLPLAKFVPIKELTTLVLETRLSSLDCIRILSELADSIVNCAFTNIAAVTVNEAGGSGHTLVTCSQLKSFHLGNDMAANKSRGRNSLREILHHTIAPKLLALTLCQDDLVGADVSAFIAHSVCSLQALELHLIVLVPDELYKVLAQLPSLRVLKIFGDKDTKPQSFSNIICEGLTNKDPRMFHQISSDDGEILCPALEMLMVDEHAISELPAGQIARMVESRISRSPLKFVWIANKSDDTPRMWDTQMTVGKTLLSHEDLGRFGDLRRDSFRWKTLKYLIIEYDRSTYSRRWDPSRAWNSEVMATLKTLGPVVTEAKEPTVFEYPSEPRESSSKVDQEQILAASSSTHVLTFVPVGERVNGSRDELYGAVENVLQQERSSAPEPYATGLIATPGMEQLLHMALERQSSLASHPIETGYEVPVLPEYNTWGMDGTWTPDPYQHFDQQNANQNDFMRIDWIDTALSNCDHVNCLCFNYNGVGGHTM